MNDSELDELLDAWKTPPVPAPLRAAVQSMFPAHSKRRISGVPLRWVAAFALAAGAVAFGASLAEDATLGSESGPLDSGTYIRRTRIVHPALAKLKWMFAGGLSTGWQWQGRKLVGSVYLLRRSNHAHYGYSWTAQPLGSGRYLFVVQSLDPQDLKEPGPIVPLPVMPAPAIVTTGSTFDVEIYESGGQRIYDHIELSAQPLGNVDRSGASKLNSASKSMQTIRLTNPKLLINGILAADSGGVEEAVGSTAMIDVPNRGRFVLTLDPQGDARFLPTGSVNGNAIDFQSGPDQFRIECSAPVAATDQRPVFVFFQPDTSIRKPQFSSGGGPGIQR